MSVDDWQVTEALEPVSGHQCCVSTPPFCPKLGESDSKNGQGAESRSCTFELQNMSSEINEFVPLLCTVTSSCREMVPDL